MKAIETKYNGYKFRSRLEARWAVFFDEMGIKYEYEPEGFELSDGTKYLPDFYLPESDCYIEIKHITAVTGKMTDKDEIEIVFSKNVDGYKYYDFINEVVKENHLFLILSGDPYECIGGDENAFAQVFSKRMCAIKNDERIKCNDCEKCTIEQGVTSFRFLGFANNSKLAYIFHDISDSPIYPDGYGIEYYIDAQSLIDSNKDYAIKHIKAANKARQARFEYGESG